MTKSKDNIAVKNSSNLDEIRQRLIDMGFVSTRQTGNFVNINIDRGYIYGVCEGMKTIKKGKEEYNYFSFRNAEGYGKNFDGKEVEIKGDVLVSSTGLMEHLLQDREGQEVGLFYLGTKKVNGYPKPLHQYELFTKNGSK